MERIYKYPLEWKEKQTIEVPIAQVLTVQIQDGKPCLWAIVSDKIPSSKITIHLVGTGQEIDITEWTRYINTVQYGGYVWHFFW